MIEGDASYDHVLLGEQLIMRKLYDTYQHWIVIDVHIFS